MVFSCYSHAAPKFWTIFLTNLCPYGKASDAQLEQHNESQLWIVSYIYYNTSHEPVPMVQGLLCSPTPAAWIQGLLGALPPDPWLHPNIRLCCT